MGSRRRIATARTLLACFVLALAAAAISPLLRAAPLQLVCSAGGKWLLLEHADARQPGPAPGHALDCALCLPAGAPPGLQVVPVVPIVPHARPCVLRPHTHVVRVASAPLPARGPPADS